MSADPRFPLPGLQPVRRWLRGVRPLHLLAVVVFSVAAVGLMALKFANPPGAAPVTPGEGLKIEVVAPVEPELVPGSVMEVGDLVDGFRYVRPASAERAPAYDVAWAEEEAAPVEPQRRETGVRRYESSDPGPGQVPEPETLGERGRRWFGFDNPRPDHAAERRARQARMEALEDQRRADFERRRRYRSDPVVERPVDEVTDGPYGPEVG